MNWNRYLTPEILGPGFILLFVLSIWLFSIIPASKTGLRLIPAFKQLKKTIHQAVEEGRRLHITLGNGSLYGVPASSALIGLAMLLRISRTAAPGDQPPVATSGNGLLAILSQDTQKTAYQLLQAEHKYSPLLGQISGLTPWSYAAGLLPVIYDQNIHANIVAGHFDSEIVLMVDASERKKNQLIAGSDSLTGQAIIYTGAQEPLIGEELYAGVAYLQDQPLPVMHIASLNAQDLLRWVLILLILAGTILKITGWL